MSAAMVKMHRRRWWWVVERGLQWRGPVEAGCGWERESMVVIREWRSAEEAGQLICSLLGGWKGRRGFG
jgi:hypothetical protein